ncbi:MAG: serine/threonine protein kinase [Gemmataceae bacterium]|nr:serine/threonine protein kinase [Gemmataceae bacterium]MDW8266365.1 serine/threonine-protein kinase [Gemmataceae bacterium]
MADLGNPTDKTIRILVAEWAKDRVAPQQCEELIALLINLARGARVITSSGRLHSGYARSENLIEELVNHLRPHRRQGEILGTGWRLERYLGRGSYGEVWLGLNEDFPAPRAFKFFTTPCKQSLTSIRREKANLANVLQRLGRHPNIVEFIDVANDDHGAFAVLEYVGGGSLEDWIREEPSKREVLEKDEVIRGIIAGLARAHSQGIYHCDLKPANVLLTDGPWPQPKIADFGLATVASPITPAPPPLSSGGPVGTAMYLPPEADDGLHPRNPAQDDVFAVGVIWYQLVVERIERPPYNFAERLETHQLDPHRIGLIARCLAEPNRRFRNAQELEEMLQGVEALECESPSGCFNVHPLLREYLARVEG